MKIAITILGAVLLSACSIDKEANKDGKEPEAKYFPFTANQYAKIDTTEVIFFLTISDVPGKYEEMGVFKVKGKAIRNVSPLKEKAASIGANGLIWTSRGIIVIRYYDQKKEDKNNVKI